ncbi:hypothetical protein QUB56_03595, partial [Microcoleus sp. AR_TQ3_B6]
GEWESGRVGEWESGRVGEWESGRVGEWEKSSFSPRTSSLLTSSLNIHPLNPLNPVHCCVAEPPSDRKHPGYKPPDSFRKQTQDREIKNLYPMKLA